MGELAVKKAKYKLREMKNCGFVVVAEFQQSGGGNGQRSEERDLQRGEDNVPIVLMGNKCSSHLKPYRARVLYLLKQIVFYILELMLT